MNTTGKKFGGRSKGTPNKISAKFRKAVLASLKRRGGAAFLDKLEADLFVKLLCHVTPKALEISDGDGNPLSLQMNINLNPPPKNEPSNKLSSN